MYDVQFLCTHPDQQFGQAGVLRQTSAGLVTIALATAALAIGSKLTVHKVAKHVLIDLAMAQHLCQRRTCW